MPKQGEVITFQNYSFRIELADAKRLKKIRVEIKKEETVQDGRS